MHAHHIDEMTDAIAKALGLKKHGRDKVRRELGIYWYEQATIVWSVDDVLTVCRGLNKEEAIHVLQQVCTDHDADRGVCWESFTSCAVELYGARACPPIPHDEDDEEDPPEDES